MWRLHHLDFRVVPESSVMHQTTGTNAGGRVSDNQSNNRVPPRDLTLINSDIKILWVN